MCNSHAILSAIEDLKASNPEQYAAVMEKRHCIVLAGPGSGKTKTLTTAMGRALLEDVAKPRGIACITYNNDCALELEQRLARLGVAPSERVFIGTVHSFSLTQVVSPYARIVLPDLPHDFGVATRQECIESQRQGYQRAFGDFGDYRDRWKFAERKRLRDVDRSAAPWTDTNPELATYIEAYEADLRSKGLIDFDDMPLLAFRMLHNHLWMQQGIQARFPILYVDEYQDLGYPLHELVMLLCFGEAGVRLFAVGDVDQSIYGFAGANPELLRGLSERGDVRTVKLRFNYRSGSKILDASMAALGETRDYVAVEKSGKGAVVFVPIEGGLDVEAAFIAQSLVPALVKAGVHYQEIAVLYRTATEGSAMATAARAEDLPFVRSDNQALIPRSNRFARFLEACASWVASGWKVADPSFARLSHEAMRLIFGGTIATDREKRFVQISLIDFLTGTIDHAESAHSWLLHMRDSLVSRWMKLVRVPPEGWDVLEKLIADTDPATGEDFSVAVLGGRASDLGRITLSTLHSAKGREFDVVIVFGANDDVIPSWRDKNPAGLKEARRLFYVGVTRPRKELHLVYSASNPSPFVGELKARVEQE
jgi:DNA helicase-2/ATP-dependent DNA helicase PcrA